MRIKNAAKDDREDYEMRGSGLAAFSLSLQSYFSGLDLYFNRNKINSVCFNIDQIGLSHLCSTLC